MRKVTVAIVFALVIMVLLILFAGESGLSVFAMPFVWAGKGLRILSLSGSFGNIVALALYVMCGVLPMLLLVRSKKPYEILLAVVLCGILLYTLYYMINPGLRPLLLTGETGDLILSGAVYSLLLGWAILKLLQRTDSMGTEYIYRALRVFLGICAAECFLIGIGKGFFDLLSDIRSLHMTNTIEGVSLDPTICFYVLSYCVKSLEFVFDASIMLLSIKLLRELERDPYAMSCCEIAEKTARRCKYALITIALSYSVLNIGQVLFASLLHNLNAVFRIPVMSIAIAFGVLGLTRLLCQGRQLKEDNDLFI